MTDHDLVFALRPDCHTTWNVRRWLGVTRAYPFDRWINPSRAWLRMIEPGFRLVDEGERLGLPSGEAYAEPASIFRRAFPRAGIDRYDPVMPRSDEKLLPCG